MVALAAASCRDWLHPSAGNGRDPMALGYLQLFSIEGNALACRFAAGPAADCRSSLVDPPPLPIHDWPAAGGGGWGKSAQGRRP
jgi:hypothetical protein